MCFYRIRSRSQRSYERIPSCTYIFVLCALRCSRRLGCISLFHFCLDSVLYRLSRARASGREVAAPPHRDNNTRADAFDRLGRLETITASNSVSLVPRYLRAPSNKPIPLFAIIQRASSVCSTNMNLMERGEKAIGPSGGRARARN